jgi:hypothetical protein
MTSLALLVLAVLLAAARHPLAAAAGVLLAAWAGTTLPDIDQLLPLGHRSALTHSVLPALAAGAHPRGRAVASGLGFGTGLHLSADLFPNAMTGYALVKLPGLGALGAPASYAWFALHALLALALGAWLLRAVLPGRALLPMLAALAAIGAVYLFGTDGGWPALALFVAGGWIAWRRRAQSIGG